MTMETLTVRVRAVEPVADIVNTYELVDPDRRPLPPFTAGAHVDVHVPGGPIRQYSLCNDPRDHDRYVVAVQREDAGRGGSKLLHAEIQPGKTLTISFPRNNFPLFETAKSHLFIAGGIGITPIMAMMMRLRALGADFHLHYCSRVPERTAFLKRLGAEFAGKVTFHFDGGDPSRGLDVKGLLKEIRPGTHLYCCGPGGLMKAVKNASDHWPPGTVHFEYFSVDATAPKGGNTAFEVEIASSGKIYAVPADKSIMQVLRDNGHGIDSSCEEGICGTCATPVKSGDIDHRDMVLSDEEKKSNRWMMVCCSRAKVGKIVLDI
ncbi:MAG: oxidoreductase [Alphaproteobacteria bacterium]|nr:oxidoreductase [Alphaproteobacteria bacterium]